MKLLTGTRSNYNSLIVSPNRQWSALLYYKNGSSWLSVPNTVLQSMTVSDGVCDNNITMGSFVSSKAVIRLIGISESLSASLCEGVKINIRLTLGSYDTSNTVTVQTPVWVISENKRSKRSGSKYDCTLTAYDISYAMTKNYAQSNPLTALQAITSIANKYGLTVNSSVSNAVSSTDGTIPHLFEPLDEELTDKQMISYFAGYYGCYAEINENEQICFSWFQPSDDIIGSNRVFDGGAYVTEMEERTIVMLESGTSDTPLVVPQDANGFSINFENPYMTEEQLTSLYSAKIANGAVSFRIGKVHYKGSPLNNPGTIVTIKDIDGDTASFYIMKRTLEYDGGLSETIECCGESESTINYKYTSPLQKKIDRSLSRMEEAIKDATDVITQTKGSVFELIPIDEADPTKGNSGWKLYSTEIGSNNVILATSSGIGFSSNGGQSFNAMAMYIDENGVGHINANCIDVGKLNADVIDTSTLIVGIGNVDGLNDELTNLLNETNTANQNASTALSTANIVNGVISEWCYNNNTTVIDGANIYAGTITAKQIASGSITAEKIATGAITAEKVNVGWQSGNCATNWYNPNGLNLDEYFTVTVESSNDYYAKILLEKAYSGTIRCSSKPFYVTAGNTVKFGGTICNKTAKQSGLYLEYSAKSDGRYSVVSYSQSSLTTARPVENSYTATTSGWYRLTCAFDDSAKDSYHSGVYCFTSVKGNMIVNGTIKSTDGLTYFDLDHSVIHTKNTNGSYYTELTSGGLTSGYNSSSAGGLQALKLDMVSEPYAILWFNEYLRIGRGPVTNNDPFMDFANDSTVGGECVRFYKTITASDALFTKCRNIKSGIVKGVTTNGATVTFDKSFLNTPRVICTPLQKYAGDDHIICVNVTEVTTSGFTIIAKDIIGSYGSDVMWIAVDI